MYTQNDTVTVFIGDFSPLEGTKFRTKYINPLIYENNSTD